MYGLEKALRNENAITWPYKRSCTTGVKVQYPEDLGSETCKPVRAMVLVQSLGLLILVVGLDQHLLHVYGEDCRITPVLHVLQSPGCNPLTIPSFACVGKCSSYVQVSGSKMWQTERSCMCCQESGEREATVTLNCPKAGPGSPKVQKVVTKAPVDCMCRPCTTVEEGSVMPQEVAGFVEDGSILSMIPPNLVQL